MKIIPHSHTPPTRPASGMPQSAPAAGEVNVDPALRSGPRPVRISRFPEEAALFAYNRQAQPHIAKPRPSVDEYV